MDKKLDRRRSLLKDKNDINTFRHHRDRHLGHCVSNEYYQPSPFFFTRECSTLNLVGQYKGASAFLILNGPSLVNGDYDLSLMKRPGIITYGVNNGPATFRPDFWSCVDDPQRFLKSIWLDPKITKFVPHAHAEKPIFDGETWGDMKEEGKKVIVGECPNCIFFHRNEKFNAGRWLFEDKINWGNSGQYGGGRSVMLPAMRILFLLGFRKIYLMGADFTMSEDYTYHFDEQRAKGSVKCNTNTYKKMKEEYFPQLQEEFKKEGLEVLNCNLNSGLDCFEKIPYLDAIAEATGRLGDVPNERTWGMYCKPGDKEKWKDEPEAKDKPYLKNLENRSELMTAARSQNSVSPISTTINRELVKEEPPNTVQKNLVNVIEVDNTPSPAETIPVEAIPVEEQPTRTVSVQPTIEQIQESPSLPIPPRPTQDGVGQIPGEKKLIKHLPFRG